MFKIQEYVDIKNYSTFKIGGRFRYFVEVYNMDDLKDIYSFSKEKGIPFFVLGGGSNIVFSDSDINILVIKINITGFEVINETDKYIDIKVGAGEIWDKLVEKTVEMNLSGIEALSLIPGTVGATPVQNVGAYGVEVKDTILEVEVYDIKEDKIVNILNKDCKFGYRDSIFKNKAKGRYVITSVIYRLSKLEPVIPKYPDTLKYFSERKVIKSTVKDIREAIISIRKEKLPDPNEIPNVGSFFKNPMVSNELTLSILVKFPNAKIFPIDEKFTKIPAGWLIENAGLKGKSFGNISVYDKNALVLINNGNATKDDLLKAKNEIIKIVEEKFGIILEQEPETI